MNPSRDSTEKVSQTGSVPNWRLWPERFVMRTAAVSVSPIRKCSCASTTSAVTCANSNETGAHHSASISERIFIKPL